MTRVRVIRTPPEHATGDKSPPCTCAGREGRIIGADRQLLFIAFDSGGKAGVPTDCCKILR